MTDITTRLRLMEADELGYGSGLKMRLYGDAADEIERLRAENEGQHMIIATERAEVLKLREELAAREWNFNMEDAPKDGTRILAKVRDDLVKYKDRVDLDRWAGLEVPVSHPGIAADGFDIGWGVALPVGWGLGGDDWFSAWMPLPPPQSEDE